jgi:hypothetical protein
VATVTLSKTLGNATSRSFAVTIENWATKKYSTHPSKGFKGGLKPQIHIELGLKQIL